MYNGYVDGFQCAENEQTMLYAIWRRLLKVYDFDEYRTTLDHSFTAFPKDVGFNNGLAAARPGLFQGFGELSFKPFPIATELGGAAVVVSNAANSIALPHLAGEFKGPGKDMEETRLQSAYDGAALVYGRNQALQYLGDADPFGHAAVITFTTDGDSMHFYAHYAAFSAETGGLEYHQYPIWEPNHPSFSFEEYRTSRKRLHNAQDFAREVADDLRSRLKDHWEQSTLAGGQPNNDDTPGSQPSGSGQGIQKRRHKRNLERGGKRGRAGRTTQNRSGGGIEGGLG